MRTRTGLFSSVVLAFVLSVGFLALSAVLVAWAHETVRSLRPVPVEERVVFLADGRAVVERLSPVQGPSAIPPEEKFLDLEGNRVAVPEDARWAQGIPLYRGQRGEGLLGGWLSPQESWDWRVQRLSDPRDPVAWYFLCDGLRHGWGYFVAYDTARAEAVGYLGTAGFRTDRLPPEEQFPFNGSDRGIVFRLLKPNTHCWRVHPIGPDAPQPRRAAPALYVQADNDRVYQVDLAARQVRVAFEGGPIWAAGLLTRPVPRPGVGRASLVVRTDDAVGELDQNKVVRRFPIPDDLRERGFLWVETASGEVVTLTDLEYDLAAARVRDQISWYDGAGRLLRRQEVWTNKSPHKDERVL